MVAIEYVLFFGGESAADRVMHTIARTLGGRTSQDECGRIHLVGGPLTVVGIPKVQAGLRSKATEEQSAYQREAYGFEPGGSVYFRLDKFDIGPGEDAVARAVGSALDACEGDLLLLRNGELPILRRQDGDLVLNDHVSFWTGGRRGHVRAEYRLQRMGVL